MLKRLSTTDLLDLDALLVEAWRAVEREPVPERFLRLIDSFGADPAVEDEA